MNSDRFLNLNYNDNHLKYFVYVVITILSFFIFLGTYLKYSGRFHTDFIDSPYFGEENFCDENNVS
jgi:hypothetical protein